LDITQLKDNIVRGLHCCVYGVSNVKNIIFSEKFRLDKGVRVKGEDYLKKQVFINLDIGQSNECTSYYLLSKDFSSCRDWSY